MADKIEHATTDSASLDWHSVRKPRVTLSQFREVCHARGQSLAKRINKDARQTADMKRGLEMESAEEYCLLRREWATNAALKKSEVNVRAMNVVNDSAERGVKLTSDFVAVAKKEQHLQNVLQAVEHDRNQKPNVRRCKRKLIPE
ncbi:unnamed protein product [Leuciscus chuanchicus]